MYEVDLVERGEEDKKLANLSSLIMNLERTHLKYASSDFNKGVVAALEDIFELLNNISLRLNKLENYMHQIKD